MGIIINYSNSCLMFDMVILVRDNKFFKYLSRYAFDILYTTVYIKYQQHILFKYAKTNYNQQWWNGIMLGHLL